MQKLAKGLLVGGSTALAIAAAPTLAADSPHAFTGKVAVYSEYEYRGISQTSEKPALQLNLDYAHASGFYVGTFLSNIKWLEDTAAAGGFSSDAKVEWDLYGGYKFEVMKDVTLDVGYLRYEYPSSGAFNPKPNTDEIYVGVSYGPATLKYSYSLNDTFGVPKSEGSDYLELSVNHPIVDKVTLNGAVGHQRYKGSQIHGFHNGDLSYTVWKIGATYDIGRGFAAGAYFKGTDADSSLYTIRGKDWGKERLVAFVSYSF